MIKLRSATLIDSSAGAALKGGYVNPVKNDGKTGQEDPPRIP